MKKKEERKYVVSEDIQILLGEWAMKKGFCLPSGDFFKQLRKEMREYLSGIFGAGSIDMVLAGEIRDGMRKFIRQTDIPVVSMDRVYVRTNPEIQIARMVDKSLNDCGTGPRFGAPSIQEQIVRVKAKYSKIALVDDVLFSGNVMAEIVSSLKKVGVAVPVVIVGIAIGEGVERIQRQTGSEVRSVKYYREVIDEICERDFYPGVPLSGRFVIGPKIETGAPYLLPPGRPHEWASIPKEKEKEFSVFCLKQTIKLWEAIEKISGKIVRCHDLERIPLGISYTNKRFVNELRRVLKLI